MSDKKISVYINLNGKDEFVGTLWAHFYRGKETSDFEYSREWLSNRKSFSLEPGLFLGSGKQVNPRQIPLFGSFSDSAPDTWGRILMRKYEVQLARENNRNPKTLNEVDYLLYVNDYARQGALRFKTEENDQFLWPGDLKSIPPLISLSQLLYASEKIIDSEERHTDLKLILAPGSSLGGARPKASVIDELGNLCIAKFPKKDDYSNNVLWESVALTLAKACGLNIQEWSLKKVADKDVIILKRFDRKGQERIHFLSAMSMLNAIDNDTETHSYLDIADAIRQYGASPKDDLIELWKRIVFSILISNTDDHLRNHGFLYVNEKGWRLSPLYDVNPSIDNKKALSTYITENDNTQSIELALEVCEYFGISLKNASDIIAEMKKAVSNWLNVAKTHGINKREIDQMESAFKIGR